MIREVIVGVAAVVLLAYGIEFVFAWFDDPREPPRVKPTIPIPILGHVIGFFQHGFAYYDILSKQNPNVEFYTIGVLNFKFYITHSPRITNQLAKSKVVSVRPFLRSAGRIHGTISEEAYATFDGHLADHFSDRTKDAMAPGPHMDEQNLRMGQESVVEVDTLLSGNRKEMKLWEWSKNVIMQAMGVGLFGREHPFKDKEIADAMWTWDEHRSGHIFGFDPTGKGYAARAKVMEAMKKYLQNVPEDASQMLRERQRVVLEGGIGEEDAYKLQATLSNAYFNTIPTLYWTIYEIYSRPALLEAIREEIRNKALTQVGEDFHLNIAALQTTCSLLLSAMQETQRIRHAQVAFRMVLEDVTIDRYRLKKGYHLHMPAKPVHWDPSIWGAHVNHFDPYRFVPEIEKRPARTQKILPSSFLPWGAAPWLCPARQFAATEIMIIMALLALRVDLAPADGSGWDHEPPLKKVEISSLAHPKLDAPLRMNPRQDGVGNWKVEIGKSKARIVLTSG
ncbi:uncharacterized protein PG998_006637 [Apiospora kogelbergensis]|uniref:uncharacterized protein n=1 Tax=Apiospora kogelbergensis TaxID=1337665 RepID=UPI00312DB7A5